MKKLGLLFCLALLLLNACSKKETALLKLSTTDLLLMDWKADNSHIKQLRGEITLNGKAVQGAIIQIGPTRAISNRSGQFSFLIDTSKLIQEEVKVFDVSHANVNGASLTANEKDLLFKQKTLVAVTYPIKIEDVKEDQNQVIVNAKAIAQNSQFPTIQTGKYAIVGTVKDSNLNPVKGAVVSTTNDNGQGWAKSAPSNEKGEYLVALTPENDADSTFRVSAGNVQYTLPPNKVFRFPDQSSDRIDIILPKEGNIINDQPPALVARQISGSMNEGIVVGLEGVDPKEYQVTVPKLTGEFVLTLPKKIWQNHPRFFEKKINQFYEKELTSNDVVPKVWLQAH